jgi:hypothetical protein
VAKISKFTYWQIMFMVKMCFINLFDLHGTSMPPTSLNTLPMPLYIPMDMFWNQQCFSCIELSKRVTFHISTLLKLHWGPPNLVSQHYFFVCVILAKSNWSSLFSFIHNCMHKRCMLKNAHCQYTWYVQHITCHMTTSSTWSWKDNIFHVIWKQLNPFNTLQKLHHVF